MTASDLAATMPPWARFGVILGEAMKEVGIECELDIPESARGRGGKDPTKLAEFLIERLG